MKYPVAVGLDGYYYCLQVRHLIEHHYLYFPTHTPLVFYLMAGVSRICGDPVIAVKWTAIMLELFLIIGGFLLMAAATDSLWMGVIAAALISFSTLHLYFIGEFVKNLASLSFLMWGAFCLVAGIKWQLRSFFVLALLSTGAAILAHLSALILVAIISICIVSLRLLSQPGLKGLMKSLVVLIWLLAWLSPAILSWQTLMTIPSQFRIELATAPEFPIRQLGWPDKTAILLILPFVFAFLIAFRKQLQKFPLFYLIGATALWSLLFTLNPFFNRNLGSGGISGRLSTLAYLQVAILVPCFVKLGFWGRTKWPAFFVLVLSPLFAVAANGPLPRGLESQYLETRSELAKGLVSARQFIKSNSLVLAPHGDEFLVTYLVDVESRHEWSYSDDPDRTLWILQAVKPESLTPSMLVLANTEMGATVLVADSQLRNEMSALTSSQREKLEFSNLHLYAALHGFTVPRSLTNSR